MIETLPQDLFVIRMIGNVVFLGAMITYGWFIWRRGGTTRTQHFVLRVLVGVSILLWILADGLHGLWGMVAVDMVILLLLGHRDIRLVWVKLMARRTAKATP